VSRIETLARAGYTAKGVVYAIIGVLAVEAALYGGKTVGARGALQEMAQEPFARILLGLTALGLFGYGLWRLIQAGLDKDHEGEDAKGLGKRLGQAVSGLVHWTLAAYAAYLAIIVPAGGGQGGPGGQGGQTSSEGLTAWLMSQDFGTLLVTLVGAAIFIAGISKIMEGWRGSYKSELMPEPHVRKLYPVCSAGIIARGVVFLIIGGFVAYAGITANPHESGGLAQALTWLRQQAYGTWLLLGVALGLVGYAIYSFIQARYRMINA